MSEKEFNLLDERWLRVIDDRCHTKEVSLIELFGDAHLYRDLCGELPTQDFAVMRLLLAVLHTVFSRYDPDGKESPLKEPDDALGRWKALWGNGRFPSEVITDYLESQRESFYLFHPERPFYQVAEMSKLAKIPNGEYNAQKLNGTLSKSAHKERLFTMIGGSEKDCLSNSQAARWLVNLNGYDDNALKAGAGIGWLGELGLIAAAGNNLFETLMLNFIACNFNNGEVWECEKPIWENTENLPLDKRKIVFPDNLSQLYTLPSRRILLKRSDDGVVGYKILGGDYFDKESAFYEPMTLWKSSDSDNSYTPKSHDSAKQFWRDFSSIFTNENQNKGKPPGIVFWLIKLNDAGIIDGRQSVYFKTAAIKYSGSQRSSVENIFSDSLQMHASLLSAMNAQWQRAVINSVGSCDEIAKKVWILAQNINLAAGGDYVPKDSRCSAAVFAGRAKAEFYDRLDLPFRKWLCALDPETDEAEDRECEWQEQCLGIARNLGNELIEQAGSAAIFGITKETKSGDKTEKKSFSAAKAMNQFLYGLKKSTK